MRGREKGNGGWDEDDERKEGIYLRLLKRKWSMREKMMNCVLQSMIL